MLTLSLCLAMIDTEEDRISFEGFYEEYKHFVLGQAIKIVKRYELAEDVSQEVFLYIAQNYNKMRDRTHRQILRYLELCAQGRACNLLENEKDDWIESDIDVIEKAISDISVEKIVLKQEQFLLMNKAVSELPNQQRIPIELRLMDIPVSEIAEMLNRPIKTVYKQIERGYKEVQRKMKMNSYH